MSKQLGVVILFLLNFVCDSCKHARISFLNKTIEGRKFIEKRTFDESGRIAVIELLNIDSVRSGYYKEYIVGKVTDSGDYNNGKKQGIWYKWDIAGNLIKSSNWFSGKQFGEEIEYYSEIPKAKNTVYKYSFYNIDGEKIFESRFGIDGKMLVTSGSPLFCVYNKSKILPGDVYELICFLGVPKACLWNLSVEESEKGSEKALFQHTYSNGDLEELKFAKRYYQRKEYTLEGIYEWRLSLEVISSKGDTLYKGVTKMNVFVNQ